MNLYLIVTLAGSPLTLTVPAPPPAVSVQPMVAYTGAPGSGASTPINVRQLQASAQVSINDSVYAKGSGIELFLQSAGATAGRLSVKNLNDIGGAAIALSVPEGCTFEFMLNGGGTVSPHQALTIEYDGAGGFWII